MSSYKYLPSEKDLEIGCYVDVENLLIYKYKGMTLISVLNRNVLWIISSYKCEIRPRIMQTLNWDCHIGRFQWLDIEYNYKIKLFGFQSLCSHFNKRKLWMGLVSCIFVEYWWVYPILKLKVWWCCGNFILTLSIHNIVDKLQFISLDQLFNKLFI